MARKRLSNGESVRILTSMIHRYSTEDYWWYGIPSNLYPKDDMILFRLRGFFGDDDGLVSIPLDDEWRPRVRGATPRGDGDRMVHIRRAKDSSSATIYFGRVEDGEWDVEVERWRSE